MLEVEEALRSAVYKKNEVLVYINMKLLMFKVKEYTAMVV
jgi:hypothetical protein